MLPSCPGQCRTQRLAWCRQASHTTHVCAQAFRHWTGVGRSMAPAPPWRSAAPLLRCRYRPQPTHVCAQAYPHRTGVRTGRTMASAPPWRSAAPLLLRCRQGPHSRHVCAQAFRHRTGVTRTMASAPLRHSTEPLSPPLLVVSSAGGPALAVALPLWRAGCPGRGRRCCQQQPAVLLQASVPGHAGLPV